MDKSFLLLRDHSFITTKKSLIKEIKRFNDSIRYLLVPIGNDIGSFILHPVKAYMKKFTHAYISFTSVIVRHSEIVFEEKDKHAHYTELQTVSKYIFSLEELLQYLHSLNRMKYCNKLSFSNESYEYDLAEFMNFRLIIYCGNNVIKDIKLDDYLGPVDILQRIKSIYKPHIEKDKYLIVDGSKWGFISTVKKKDLTMIFGCPLLQTKSYQFISGFDLDMIKTNIKDIFCSSLIYNPNIDKVDENIKLDEISEYLFDCGSVRYHDIWTHSINDSLEYIVYIPTIYMNLISYAELTDFSKINNVYTIQTKFEISLLDIPGRYSLEIISNPENQISLNKFIKILSELYEGMT